MRVKFLSSLALIMLLVGVSLAWRRSTIRSQSREPATISVEIDQLPAKDGVIPVEIVQPNVSSSAPNQLDDFTYIIRNNSGNAIVAVAVIKTITYVESGTLYADSRYSMMDSAFHPDMGSAKPFEPETQRSMEAPGPLRFDEGVVIKEIRLKVDYVLYNDNTAYGAGQEGERRINAMREGARAYKKWLKQKYSRGGKSLALIFPLMQEPRVPDELKLNSDQILGADSYRLHLLRTFQTRGAAEVEKYLGQNR